MSLAACRSTTTGQVLACFGLTPVITCRAFQRAALRYHARPPGRGAAPKPLCGSAQALEHREVARTTGLRLDFTD